MSKARVATFDRQTTETQIKGALTIDGQRPLRRPDRHPLLRSHARAVHAARRLRPDARTRRAISTSISITRSRTSASCSARRVLKALGDRKGINRAGYFVMPMDETLAVVAIDLSGRPHAVVDLKVRVRMVGDLQSELVHDFFDGFASGARANVHVKVLYGRSSHHHIEAVFKAFARALRVACAKDARLAKMLPSTKGLL